MLQQGSGQHHVFAIPTTRLRAAMTLCAPKAILVSKSLVANRVGIRGTMFLHKRYRKNPSRHAMGIVKTDQWKQLASDKLM